MEEKTTMDDFKEELEASFQDTQENDVADITDPAWQTLVQYLEDKTVLTVKIGGIVKSGVVAYVEGIRGFIPASKLSLGYVENLEDWLNKKIQVQVITADPENQKLVLSARELLREKAAEGVEVTDEQVQEEFDKRVATQKESYDANPAGYVTAENNGTANYYAPEGYRGVKNLLIRFSTEKQNEIKELNTAITSANKTLTDAQKQLDTLNGTDTAEYDEESKASHEQEIAALNETIATAQATLDESNAKLETVTAEAYDEILATAQDVLARAQAGEDFDALLEEYGEDTGMKNEPNKSRGYLVCEGLSVYEQSFQDAAMALEKVGDISAELVKTSYGYHILQYATDVTPGAVELTEEIKSDIYNSLLSDAKDAAYESAVTQWVSEADVKTFPKVMK